MTVVCSPGQTNRWRLNAIANGVDPAFVEVDEKHSHQGRGNSNDPTVQYTLYYDPTWQDADSFLGKLTREQRKPTE